MIKVRHDDIMISVCFLDYWPFVRGIHQGWLVDSLTWMPLTRASNVDLWCFFRCYCQPGPSCCLLLRVSSDYAQLITGQVTEVICPWLAEHSVRAQNKLLKKQSSCWWFQTTWCMMFMWLQCYSVTCTIGTCDEDNWFRRNVSYFLEKPGDEWSLFLRNMAIKWFLLTTRRVFSYKRCFGDGSFFQHCWHQGFYVQVAMKS